MLASCVQNDLMTTVESQSSKGRIVKARVPIAAGTIVWKEQAVVQLERMSAVGSLCSGCMKVKPLEVDPCSQCKRFGYCSEACQNANAEHHKLVCPAMREVPEVAKKHKLDVDLLSMLVELLSMKYSSTELPPSLKSSADTFEANYAHVMELVGRVDLFSAAYLQDLHSAMQDLAPALNQCDKIGDADRLVSIIQANAHGDQDGIMFGLFPGLSMLCHSCKPNCIYDIVEKHVTIRVCTDVVAGEELTISYLTDLCTSRTKRQQQLMTERHFTCECPRCIAELENGVDLLEAIQCPNTACGAWNTHCLEKSPDVGVVVCTKCQTDLKLVEVSKIVDDQIGPLCLQLSQRFCFQDVAPVKETAVQLSDKIADAGKRARLHEQHEILCGSYRLMMLACEKEKAFSQAAKWGKRLLACMESFLPQFNLEKATVLRQLIALTANQLPIIKSSNMPAAMQAQLLNIAEKFYADCVEKFQQNRKVCLGK